MSQPRPQSEDKLTPVETFAVSAIRLNKASPRREIRRKWKLGRWEFDYSWRSKKNLWGRFGGGWNWKLDIQIGGTTTILSLLVCELIVSRRKS